MNVSVKLGGFAALLAAAFGIAWAAGAAFGPSVEPAQRDAARPGDAHGAHDGAATSDAPMQLVVDRTAFVPGRERDFTFQVRQAGEPLTSFDREAGVQMHLIVVRNDLTRYQHLHPVLDGRSWRTALTLPDAGDYTAFVDVERDGERTVLRTRLSAAGTYAPDLTRADARRVDVDGYDVELRDRGGELRFVVERDGRPVELEDYIGATGHLVALHHDDLEYQHVHPLEGSADNEPAFAAEFDRPGTYRLFLQFRHGGAVHTATFDREVRG